ncbi:MAG: hypothetical protein AAB601_02800 [Patescibacteria group bacterium]
MDEEVRKRFDEQGKQLEAIYRSVEKTRKYFLAVLVISIVMILLPALGLFFVIPQFLETLSIYSTIR